MPDKPEIQQYVEAATTSSNRGRFVIIAIVTITVLSFAAFWNSRQGSWLHARLHVARVAAKACPFNWDSQVRAGLSKEEQDIYDQSREFASVRHITDCTQLSKLVSELQDIQSRDIDWVRVPFFGFAFDVNDLGILGGFSFVIVLMWFRFSLVRELSNLRLAFDVAKERAELQACYDLLAMHQVLTVPRVRGEVRQRLWGWLPLGLYILPGLAQLAVVVNDFRTFDHGWSVSQFNTLMLYAVNLAFLLLIVILIYLCVELSLTIDKVWDETADDLGM